MIVTQNLANVLAVGRNDPLLNPDFAPIGIDCGFSALHKGVQQQRRLPCICVLRQLNIETLFLLVVQEGRQILLLLRRFISNGKNLHMRTTFSRSFPISSPEASERSRRPVLPAEPACRSLEAA